MMMGEAQMAAGGKEAQAPAHAAVIVEAALNGGRDRAENPGVPYTPGEVAEEARRCAEAGAQVVHFHARGGDGGWSADAGWYAEAIRLARERAPRLLVSATSLRPAGVPVGTVVGLLDDLAAAGAKPDLISVNVGHIVVWEPVAAAKGGLKRRTLHYPNDYADVVALLAACRRHGVAPELGLMDLGFVSQLAALVADGVAGEPAWLLLELDTPASGAGTQVAPATAANYEALAAAVRGQFPRAAWAAHGAGVATYDVALRALEDGPRAHVRMGLEDSAVLPDGRPARSNAEQVAWAVERARERGRRLATAEEARGIIARGERVERAPES